MNFSIIRKTFCCYVKLSRVGIDGSVRFCLFFPCRFSVVRSFVRSLCEDGTRRADGDVGPELPAGLPSVPNPSEKVEQERHRVQREVARDGAGACVRMCLFVC